MNRTQVKQRILHELKEFLIVSLFIAPFFLSFTAYRLYLLHQPGNRLFEYGVALFKALVLAKIILIGEWARLGKRSENKPLVFSTLHKAGMFTVLYLIFDVLEDTVRGLLHGATFPGALHEVATANEGVLLVKALTVFFAFIPLFALFEMRRVMGEERFRWLFLGRGPRSAGDSQVDAEEPSVLRR